MRTPGAGLHVEGPAWHVPGARRANLREACREGAQEARAGESLPLHQPARAGMVKLSVGGRFFETSYATLCTKEPNSVLASLFGNPGMLQRNSTGEVPLDLDPDAFELVLAWLRAGLLPCNLGTERTDRLHTLVIALQLESFATPPTHSPKQPQPVLVPETAPEATDRRRQPSCASARRPQGLSSLRINWLPLPRYGQRCTTVSCRLPTVDIRPP